MRRVKKMSVIHKQRLNYFRSSFWFSFFISGVGGEFIVVLAALECLSVLPAPAARRVPGVPEGLEGPAAPAGREGLHRRDGIESSASASACPIVFFRACVEFEGQGNQ